MYHYENGIASAEKPLPQESNGAFVLTLPGKILDVSLFVNRKKKVRSRGGRDGALAAMRQLEEDGLGKLVLKKSKGSIKVGMYCV